MKYFKAFEFKINTFLIRLTWYIFLNCTNFMRVRAIAGHFQILNLCNSNIL